MKRSFSLFTFLLISSMTFVAMSANATGGAGSGGGNVSALPEECIVTLASSFDSATTELDMLQAIASCHPTPEQTVCSLRVLGNVKNSTQGLLKQSLDTCFNPALTVPRF